MWQVNPLCHSADAFPPSDSLTPTLYTQKKKTCTHTELTLVCISTYVQARMNTHTETHTHVYFYLELPLQACPSFERKINPV